MREMLEPKVASEKDTPISEIEGITGEVRGLSLEVLELAIKIEEFFLGGTPVGASEQKEKSSVGWYQCHFDRLREIKETLSIAMRHLQTMSQLTK